MGILRAVTLSSLLLLHFEMEACTCKRVSEEETTNWGGNELVVVVHEGAYRKMSGLIEHGGEPVKGALVEILDNPDYLLAAGSKAKPAQKRMAVCQTGADGKFCFKNLTAGKYELRASIGPGWNVTSSYIVIAQGEERKQRLT